MDRDEQETTCIVVKLSGKPKTTDMIYGTKIPRLPNQIRQTQHILFSAAVKPGNNEIHEHMQLHSVVRRTSAGNGRTFLKLSSSQD